ncbi:MAG: histidine kinase [Clostridia bacterium]
MQKRKADPIILMAMVLPVALFLVMCFRIGPGTTGNQLFELPPAVQIRGEYCADGGQWLALSQEHPFVNKNYETVVIRGQLSVDIPQGQYLILMMRNLWADLRVDGTTVATNRVMQDGTRAQTPGYSIAYAKGSSIPKGSSVELSLCNPYRIYQEDPYTEFMENLYVGTRDMLYAKMIVEQGGLMALSLVLCALLPMLIFSSGIIRKTEPYHFMAFLLVTLGCQLYLGKESAYLYLPLFISNPVLCMALDLSTVHLCTIAVVYFVFTSLNKHGNRCFMAVVLALAMAGSMLSICLHGWGIMDLYPGQILLFPAIMLCCTGGALCLSVEAKRYNNQNAKMTLISLIPIAVAGIVEIFCGGHDGLPQRVAIRVGTLIAFFTQFFLFVRQKQHLKRERDRYRDMEIELVKSQTTIMLSQIQPHFLYNALSAIAQMCETKPASAKKATIAFSEYLRNNMQSLKTNRLVPFEEELRHLANYLMLEQMRFGEELQIVYHIEATDFRLPPLTVQPLVENAVKYGVGMSENGGTVTISSRHVSDGVEITIADDGVGYDPAEVQFDGRTHIGINNVRQRLSFMCSGTLRIAGVKGVGTTATIHIPVDVHQEYGKQEEAAQSLF